MPRHTGWADNARSLAAGVAIGEKTKCKYCKKVKRINQFSNKQQLDLKKMILAKGNKGNEGHQSNGWISCKSCTSGQNTEMFCVVCEETKALDQFAKTHRRTRDNAVEYYDCVISLLWLTQIYRNARPAWRRSQKPSQMSRSRLKTATRATAIALKTMTMMTTT